MSKRDAWIEAARTYLRDHPEELGRALRSALGLRVGVPLAALRWLGKQAEKQGKLEDLSIDSVPPGLRVAASLDLMGTAIRARADVYIDRIVFSESELTIALRLEEIDLRLNGEATTPVGALIKSRALDLSNPGTLLAYLPKRPPILADARENRITLDLMRDPKLGRNELVRAVVAVLTSFVTLHGVEADEGHVDVSFRALPTGLGGAVRAVRQHVVLPSLGKLLPGSR